MNHFPATIYSFSLQLPVWLKLYICTFIPTINTDLLCTVLTKTYESVQTNCMNMYIQGSAVHHAVHTFKTHRYNILDIVTMFNFKTNWQ